MAMRVKFEEMSGYIDETRAIVIAALAVLLGAVFLVRSFLQSLRRRSGLTTAWTV